MWKDNDDKIMGILDSIETQNKGCFPVVCPICGEKDGHVAWLRKDYYIFTEIEMEMKKEVCGYGAVNAIILHMLCAVCLNGGKIWIK